MPFVDAIQWNQLDILPLSPPSGMSAACLPARSRNSDPILSLEGWIWRSGTRGVCSPNLTGSRAVREWAPASTASFTQGCGLPSALPCRGLRPKPYLPCRPGSELWRPESSQSRLDLHRRRETMWPVLAPTALHQCRVPLCCHLPARARSAALTGAGKYTRVRPGTTPEKESGSLVCRAQNPDRTVPLALTKNTVRSGAVLLGSSGAEHQAVGSFPKLTNSTAGSHRLEKREEDSTTDEHR